MQEESRKMTLKEHWKNVKDNIIFDILGDVDDSVKVVNKLFKSLDILKEVITINIDLRDPTESSFIQIRDNLDRRLVVYQTIDYNKAKILKEIFE